MRIAAQNGLFMSDDGRTFFSTKAALVPFDTNGKWMSTSTPKAVRS